MDSKSFNDLLDQYLTGSIAAADQEKLFSMLQQPEYFSFLQNRLEDDWEHERYEGEEDLALREIIERAVNDKINNIGYQPQKSRLHFLRRSWAAAAIIFLVVTVAYIWIVREKNIPAGETDEPVAAIAPGKDGAILELADETEVLLDTIRNGIVALQGGITARVVQGKLLYEGDGKGTETYYHTMKTPKGRQYQVVLPDGSAAWLNAASSIRFPTVFANERTVAITGEVYFEVAKNEKQPFRVDVNGRAEIQVTGTHFNVNAYENESYINATLLEGGVEVRLNQVRKQQTGAVLKPGQQAEIKNSQTEGIRVVSDVDIEKVVAWKNGLFVFENASLQEIMRQLERWYDIEVVYEKEAPDVALMGKITRGVSLNALLTALEKMGVRFRLVERKLIVLS